MLERGVLSEWLGPIPRATFVADYLRRAPIAQPSTGTASLPLLDWDVLDRVLGNDPDVLVVAKGQLLPLPAPKSVKELRGYLAMGIGLCLRHTERCDPGLARIAASFTDLGTSQVQLFITPAGTHGFSWHYDDEDVFIVQTVGVKDYYFRENTVAADVTAHGSVFGAFTEETSPICMATLVPGDFLYIPARWWHMAICHEDALSISVGVMTRQAGASLASSRG